MSLENWLSAQGFGTTLVPLKGDASARRYYRLNKGIVVVDSANQKEALRHFVAIAKLLQVHNICTPKILAYDLVLGYAVLEDLGNVHLFDLKEESAQMQRYMDEALEILVKLQRIDAAALPPYDKAFLMHEMTLMPQWYLEGYLQKKLTADQKHHLEAIFERIATNVLMQPQSIFVHRDFHSKNIMVNDERLFLIDFQDARSGALTYDAVSLIKDLYIPLLRKEQIDLAQRFYGKLQPAIPFENFLYFFDITGLQRHIKVLGIFARLALRDNKPHYLAHIPQTLTYIDEVLDTYSEFDKLKAFLKDRR